MKCVWYCLVFAAAAASAGYYLDERFNGSGLPSGWRFSHTNIGNWSIVGGPWGNCIMLHASGTAHGQSGTAVLETSCIAAAAGTIYYRFDYRWTWSAVSSSLVGAGFRMYAVGSSTPLASIAFNPNEAGPWRVLAGSFDLASSASLYGYWYAIGAGSGSFYYGQLDVYIDTVQVSNESMTGAAPASLGRVKALYR